MYYTHAVNTDGTEISVVAHIPEECSYVSYISTRRQSQMFIGVPHKPINEHVTDAPHLVPRQQTPCHFGQTDPLNFVNRPAVAPVT